MYKRNIRDITTDYVPEIKSIKDSCPNPAFKGKRNRSTSESGIINTKLKSNTYLLDNRPKLNDMDTNDIRSSDLKRTALSNPLYFYVQRFILIYKPVFKNS